MISQPANPNFGYHRPYRTWAGRLLHPIDEAHMFFNNEGPVPETLRRLVMLLTEANLPHIFIGAIAVNAHGLRRSTRDVDVCMRADDLERFTRLSVGSVFETVKRRPRRFFDPETQVNIDVLLSGAIAGDVRKQREVRFPDPSEAEFIDGVALVALPRLLELKLVTWRFRDWGDVVDLIRQNKLDGSYGDRFNPLVRQMYIQCYDQMIEEDRYNPEIDDPSRQPQGE